MQTLTDENKKAAIEAIALLNKILAGPSDLPKLNHFTDVKSFEDALKFKGMKEEDVLPYNNPTDPRKVWLNSLAKLELIADVIQEGWIADWSNDEQKKWRCWFEWDTEISAFVFDDSDYVWTGTYAVVGSRLCFENSDKAEYFGQQFIELHNQILIK